jgi:hypothetical protein
MIPPVGLLQNTVRSAQSSDGFSTDHEDLDRAFGDHHDRCDSQEALADGALILHKPSVRFDVRRRPLGLQEAYAPDAKLASRFP